MERLKTMKNFVLKICVLGEGGVGKTTLLHRFIEGEFKADTKMTIGTGLTTKDMVIDDKNVICQLWDFAGEKRFRFFLPSYLRGASGILLCFDISRYPTFKRLDEWYEIIMDKYSENEQILYLIGTKKDLEGRRSVESEEVKNWMEDKKFVRFIESSSKTGENVEHIFKDLVSEILNLRIGKK